MSDKNTMPESLSVNGVDYTIVKLLGHGRMKF